MNMPQKRSKVYEFFRRQILAGRLQAGAQLPAQTALAAQFKVSPVTVQRSIEALVQQGFVRTQPRGGTFVAERPPHLCRYGLVFVDTPELPQTWTLFHNALANEAISLSRSNGWRIDAYHGVDGHVDCDAYQRLLDDVREGILGGVIIAAYPSALLSTPLLQDPDLPRVAIMGVPGIAGIPRVWVDLEGLVDRALDELAATGRRRVAIVLSDGMYRHCPDYYLPALQKRGFPAHPWWIQILERRPVEAVRHAVQLLMRPGQTDRPDALLVLDDNLVENACAGLVAAGVRVPDEVSVVAHCNFPWPPPAVLPLRRIGFDARQVLVSSVECINRQRRGENIEPSVLIPARFEDELLPKQP